MEFALVQNGLLAISLAEMNAEETEAEVLVLDRVCSSKALPSLADTSRHGGHFGRELKDKKVYPIPFG